MLDTDKKKGLIYVDGLERPDILAYRNRFSDQWFRDTIISRYSSQWPLSPIWFINWDFSYWPQGNHLNKFGLSDSVYINICGVISVSNELQFWMLLWGNFGVLIELSLFGIFKLFWFIAVQILDKGSAYLILRLERNLLTIFPSWQTYTPYIFFYWKIVPQYNQNELET